MLDRDKIKDLVSKVQVDNFVEFKQEIFNDIEADVDVAGKEYIDSGDAFNDFVNSKRFTEAKEDINDVAVKYYKKFKGNAKLIQKELEKDKYSLKEITTIMKLIKDM